MCRVGLQALFINSSGDRDYKSAATETTMPLNVLMSLCLQSADRAALQGLLSSTTSSHSAHCQQCPETWSHSQRESSSSLTYLMN